MIPIKKKKRIMIRLVLILVILTSLFSITKKQSMEVFADDTDLYRERLEFDDEGTLWMTTRDRKATGSISYYTLGWTLKREDKAIDETETVRVKLEQYTDSVSDPENDDYIYSYFRIGKEKIYSQIAAKSSAWAEELYKSGSTLYLDAIMTVRIDGECIGTMSYDGTCSDNVYFTEEGIAGAELWRDPSALATHYNKAVYFSGNPAMLDREPVQVETIEEVHNGSLIQEEDLPTVNTLSLTSTEYEVEEAIPSGEKVELSSSIEQYYYEAIFYHYTGYYVMPITAKMTYTLVWNDGTYHEEKVTVTEFYDVKREYSYWKFGQITLYYLNLLELRNAALNEGGEDVIQLENDAIPSVNWVKNQAEYLRLPNQTVELDGGVIRGDKTRPYLPYGSASEKVEAAVGQIEVNNDGFAIDEATYLNAGWKTKETEGPTFLEEEKKVDFSKEALEIPNEIRNGTYESEVAAHYLLFGGEEEKIVTVSKTNGIKVHTPVVCHAILSDEKEWNQQVVPTTNNSLILGRNFTVEVSAAGEHIEAKGYGSRDYQKYVSTYQILLPFDVYYDTQYIKKNQWFNLTEGTTTFFLPEAVEEGDYKITIRALALNYQEPIQMEANANLDALYDAAAVEQKVTVVGRLFGFKITNIIDYPRWQNVFWNLRTMERTGTSYYAGIRNENGEQKREETSFYLCPILKGSHPYRENAGPVGLGYQIEFEVTLVGHQAGKKKGLKLIPTYYYMKEDGSERQKVKLYSKTTLEEIEVPFSFVNTNSDLLSAERQTFSGTCLISPDIYVVPADIDLKKYVQKKGGRIDTKDEIFLQGGYLVVNTAFLSYQDEMVDLSYQNVVNAQKGYCDMWKTEGFLTTRVDSTGTAFEFKEGDTLVFDLTNTILSDYESMGTH